MADFIDGLDLPEVAKVEMKKLTPANYIGRAVEFIDDDELVEITPKSIRIRKRYLIEHERKRASREA